MAELVLNKFKLEIKKEPTELYFISEEELNTEDTEKYYLSKYKPTKILEYNWNFLNEDITNWLNKLKGKRIENEEYVYISFFQRTTSSSYEIKVNFQNLPFALQKKFLKEVFIKTFQKNNFIIEPNKEGVDFSVYKKNNTEDNQYTRFDFVFNAYKDKNNNLFYDVIISVGSTDSYILKIPTEKHSLIQNYKLKFVDKNFLIKNKELGKNVLSKPIKANFEIRRLLDITSKPKKKFYRDYYSTIKEFVFEVAKNVSNEWFTLSTAFSQILDTNIVGFGSNKMVFKGGNEDYATVNGMRDYGPYKIPDDIKKTQLFFIYPDSESANKLYTYFARGYRHFPGLESYVGIPANIFENGIRYASDLDSLPKKINSQLTQKNYSNVIAVCIMPFSKSTATSEQSKIYYQIKEQLLIKNIPSQFIHRDKIFGENFHFSLPNIAIAMLAKCGGIPWKLAKPRYNQLTIGFNIKPNKMGNSYLGSAVFFDNEGIIREVNGYKEGNLNTICDSLQQAIDKYKKDNEEILNKVVIHFYKSLSNKEVRKIEQIIKDTLSKDSVFAIVEINDTKTSTELGFDLSYESYMPQSGTYFKLKPNEYLLFNNLRYWGKPMNPINQEELPIKLRIYDPFNSFDHHELISQVYEFSRMYWKSLKQKAQPVTITYSKLIAEFMSEFEGGIPDNEVAKKRVWFI